MTRETGGISFHNQNDWPPDGIKFHYQKTVKKSFYDKIIIMKKAHLTKLLFALLLITTKTEALVCPPKDSAPLCPQNGITLLDETYPTQSFLISNLPYIPSKEAKGMTQNFVNKIIKNYDYENVPQILMALKTPEEFTAFKNATKEDLINKKVSEDKIEKIMAQLTHVAVPNYNWQQDWFESFIDIKTGAPVIKSMESYARVPANAGDKIEKAGSACNIKTGEWLKDDYINIDDDPRTANKSFGSGEMGGNIEGAPGGFCMIGDNVGKNLAKQICKDKDNIIQLQTSWLSVGHVDELFKIIPTQFNDGRPRECEFSLMSASPKKALELMKNPTLGQTSFTDFSNPDADPLEMRSSRSNINNAGNFYLCQYIEEAVRNRPKPLQISPAVKSVLIKILFNNQAIASEASMQEFLETIINDDKKLAAFNASCAQNFDKITNLELQAVMLTDTNFLTLNSAVDESIQNDRELIKNKILSRLPQCKEWYNELEVPNLFYGDLPIKNKEGKLELPRPGIANSFLPNPTNSVLMNKTITFPDTGNKLFNSYLSEEIAKKKMKSDFISTWDYAHLAQGNIHCASHSIPHCRPNTKGK